MADSSTKQECPDFGPGFSLLSDLELERGIKQSRFVLRMLTTKLADTLDPRYTLLTQSGLECLQRAKQSAQNDLEAMLSEHAKRTKQRELKRHTITLPVTIDQYGKVVSTGSAGGPAKVH